MRKQDMADFKQSREEQRKPFGELTVKLDIDASDAIRALKALQREARKATQALREFEAEVAKAKTTNITVKDEADVEKIAKELTKRLREVSDRD
jgi:hypothetical protein